MKPKALDNNGIPDIECPLCERPVKCGFYTDSLDINGEQRYWYQHLCSYGPTTSELAQISNYNKQSQASEDIK